MPDNAHEDLINYIKGLVNEDWVSEKWTSLTNNAQEVTR